MMLNFASLPVLTALLRMKRARRRGGEVECGERQSNFDRREIDFGDFHQLEADRPGVSLAAGDSGGANHRSYGLLQDCSVLAAHASANR